VRVVTLNTWNVSGPWEQRLPLIRAGLDALDADVICLQEVVHLDALGEVPSPDAPTSAHAIAAGLAGGLDRWQVRVAWAGARARRTLPPHGNAILSHHPVAATDEMALPTTRGESRVVLGAELDTPLGRQQVFTTHLNWRLDHAAWRERQVQALCDLLRFHGGARSRPPVLAGDFNAAPDTDAVRFITGRCSLGGRSMLLLDAWEQAGDGSPGLTWDNANPFAAAVFEPALRIDYVFAGLPHQATGVGRLGSARVVLDTPTGGVYPSDHYGVCADIVC